MIQRCRQCGVIRGGLVSHEIPMEVWPDSDLCPQCVHLRESPTPEDKELADSIMRIQENQK